MAHRSQEIALSLRGALHLTIQPGDDVILQRRFVRVLKNLLPLAVKNVCRLDQKKRPSGYLESPSLQVHLTAAGECFRPEVGAGSSLTNCLPNLSRFREICLQ